MQSKTNRASKYIKGMLFSSTLLFAPFAINTGTVHADHTVTVHSEAEAQQVMQHNQQVAQQNAEIQKQNQAKAAQAAQPKTGDITFRLLDGNTVVKSETISGQYGQTVDVSTLMPQGYHLVADQNNIVTIGNPHETVTVHVVPAQTTNHGTTTVQNSNNNGNNSNNDWTGDPSDLSGNSTDIAKGIPTKGFDKSVLKRAPELFKITKREGMSKYNLLLLSIMEVETRGLGNDIFQSSESAGMKVGTLDNEHSMEQAVRALKGIVNKAQEMDKAEAADPSIPANQRHHFADNLPLLAQSYGFGGNFLNYVQKHGGNFSVSLAKKYSHDVVAPSLGNGNGETYKYSNPISKFFKDEYLYRNGGNYYYSEMVSQYLANGTFAQQALTKMSPFVGQPYVFGGKTPQSGFDCSGFVSWGLAQAGISLPSYTVTQFASTDTVDDLNDVQPGDLVFFKGTYGGPDFVSHVGMMVTKDIMLNANSDGVSFTSLNDNYWKSHFAGIHRVRNVQQANQPAQQDLVNQIASASGSSTQEIQSEMN